MDLKIHTAYLPHTDPDASIVFYRDTLGWEIRQDVGYEGMRWLTVGPAGQPDTNIVLFPPAADPGVTEEEQATIAAMMAKGPYAGVNLQSTDLDGEFARLQSDVEGGKGPPAHPYGTREAAIRDPAGNLIRINQRA